eukprot:CAMPEP_0204070728 /NCGR_PEP_ID=MMETSP0360-20130528/158952_1 /ASSEMBLY_ACC=CAM_ASM_000342 /TAXON_ID=268821 /ORGANISM="Scrippsiella Hangoei, Strain SHTV-5" /LENGTH=41 /DNA_ID= /DNA_START= /DNA_END= /DNA_ORIENTATION=
MACKLSANSELVGFGGMMTLMRDGWNGRLQNSTQRRSQGDT